MTRNTLTQLAIALTVFVLFIESTTASELNDSKFGFRLSVPEEFTEIAVDASEPDTLYKFVDREPTPDNPACAIQIQRLRGLIAPNSRLQASEIPAVEGMQITLQEFTWKGLDLDVMRQTTTSPTGVGYVVFCIQYPLSDEAVQLVVGGPAREEQQVYSLFSQLAGTFQNTKPLYSPTVRKLPPDERTQKLITGIVRLCITAIVIAFLVHAAKRAFSKKKNKG